MEPIDMDALDNKHEDHGNLDGSKEKAKKSKNCLEKCLEVPTTSIEDCEEEEVNEITSRDNLLW